MHRLLLPGAALALALLAAPSQGAPMVASILDGLSHDRFQEHVEALEGLGTRYYAAPENAVATDYLFDAFAGFGLQVAEHAFRYNGHDLANVEATLPGLTRPDDIFIIGAHFDSIASRSAGNPSMTDAPGADDNASGTAGLLEVARVLSPYAFDATIRFIGFNAEEQGMRGSYAYAADAKAAGERIRGMISLDMIGYPDIDPANDLDLLGDRWIVDAFLANVDAFTGLTGTAHYTDPRYSDHEPFAASRYPGSASMLAIDAEPGRIWSSNPYYHTVNDTSDLLDYDFALEVTRAAAATMLSLAVLDPSSVPVPGTWLLVGLGLLGLGAGRWAWTLDPQAQRLSHRPR
ncbi:M20/M25/M40 family metallo-hydrolase [uncultured Thiohalocapsa sp.]|uniref:M28 family metallopeptidase n=1 Tax=uncultured Thiohalocapsa sp. TaxID=768990 RepID=UPI0025EAAE2E|nr:M20/M25/M40 family metallo-hydrolase [uncultured Thiohalocapsa sp.]